MALPFQQRLGSSHRWDTATGKLTGVEGGEHHYADTTCDCGFGPIRVRVRVPVRGTYVCCYGVWQLRRLHRCRTGEFSDTKMEGSVPSTLPQLYIQTPLLRSRKLSELVGANVWLKMETVQTSGSFKSRGLSLFAKKVSSSMYVRDAPSIIKQFEQGVHYNATVVGLFTGC